MFTVLREDGDDGHYHKKYLCKCECGNTFHATKQEMKRRETCGCVKHYRKTHGETKTRLYKCWQDMKSRCNRKSRKDYPLYGGRGISYAIEWGTFEAFREWALSHGYTDNLELDRINCNGNYEPNNCRWVTRKAQCNNLRRNHILCVDGVAHTLSEWSDITGIPYTTLRARANILHWDDERCVKTPYPLKGGKNVQVSN